ncbi:MAG: sialidase family protein [Polyangiaceae bacterium]
MLAPDVAVVTAVPTDGVYAYVHDPGIARLDDGRLVCAVPIWSKASAASPGPWAVTTRILVSDDGGASFAMTSELPCSDATPFVHQGALYMFVQPSQWQGWQIVASRDRGATFTPPVDLFSGGVPGCGGRILWNCQSPLIALPGRIVWALQACAPDWTAASVVLLVGDTSRDLADPAAWTLSAPLGRPATPAALDPGLPRFGWPVDAWLEPNVVSVGGKLRVLSRTILDGYAAANLAVVSDVVAEPAGLSLGPARFVAMPGGQNKFFILRDEPSRAFWMLSNLAADPEGAIFDWNAIRAAGHFANGPGNDRRFLMLWYSVDAMSWFPAGCVARAERLDQSFMYPCAVVDGADLVVLSRTSRGGRNQHDADAATLHRVRDFRALAMNLYPT